MMSKRTRSRAANSKETEQKAKATSTDNTIPTSASKSTFTSFQPKKFRPQQNSASRAAVSLPIAEQVLERKEATSPTVATTNTNFTNHTDAPTQSTELDSAGALKFAVVPDISHGKTVKNVAVAGRHSSSTVLRANLIPDDTTYKTELEIVSNFDASVIIRPEHFRPAGLNADGILQMLLSRWAEAQTVWCHPPPGYSHQLSVMTKGKAGAPGSGFEAGFATLVESVFSVCQLFLQGKVDTFLLYTPDDSANRASISANFLMDVHSKTDREVHCCVVSSVNLALMHRLQVRGVVFEVLVPYPYLIDVVGNGKEPVHGQQPTYKYVSGVLLDDLGARMLYKIRVVGKGGITAVVDEVVAFSLSGVEGDGNRSSRRGTPLQIISTMPFSHASICESTPTITRIVQNGNTTNNSGHLSIPKINKNAHNNSNPASDAVTNCRIVLKGYFTIDAVQALTSVMTALSMRTKAVSDASDSDINDDQYADHTCLAPAFLQQRKRSRGTSARPAASVLKDPMRLTVSKRSILIPSNSGSSSTGVAQEAHTTNDTSDESLPQFSITASEYVGVPFLSSVSKVQKAKLKMPLESSLHQGFVVRELSWKYSGHNVAVTVDNPVSKYRVVLTKYAIDHAVPVALLGTEKEILLEKKNNDIDNSLTLDPLNAYSVYAS